ncbi:hypothetical protein C0J52_08317 [Blattella germanica]|nr:hypothetical protein C0J52_08317 [Blattella germanica]
MIAGGVRCSALPFRTVERWVAAFRDESERVEHMPRSGHPPRYRTIEDVKQAAEHNLRTINRFGNANGNQRLPRR